MQRGRTAQREVVLGGAPPPPACGRVRAIVVGDPDPGLLSVGGARRSPEGARAAIGRIANPAYVLPHRREEW